MDRTPSWETLIDPMWNSASATAMVSRAYKARSGEWSTVVVTATSGGWDGIGNNGAYNIHMDTVYGVYDTPYGNLAVPAAPPKVEPVPVRRHRVRYWLLLLGLSIASIWPAWGPSIGRAILDSPIGENGSGHVPATRIVVPLMTLGSVQWRYYVIKLKNGDTVHAPGDHFAWRDYGKLAIATPHETVYEVPQDSVVNIAEESIGTWAGASQRTFRNGTP